MATTSEPGPLSTADLTAPPAAEWVRITGERFDDPLGWGPGESRFVPPGAAWGGVYLAADVVTAFREAVVRDRALGPGGGLPLVTADDLTNNGGVLVRVPGDLRVVDLVDGPLATALDTDRRGGRGSPHPGRWAAAWRGDAAAPDGVLYPSRFTGRPCLFVYDRAAPRLAALWRRRLDLLPDPHGAALGAYLARLAAAARRSPR